MSNEKLINVANDTMDISNTGEYVFNNKLIKLKKSKSGILYPELYFNKKSIKPNRNVKKNPTFIVENKPVVDRILACTNNNICVLNFASATRPGGGFLNGAMAQEESMAYCSDLYNTLYDTRLYVLNKTSTSIYYTDNMLLSEVTFFKNSDFQLIQNPKTVKVITSPAVNMNKIPNNNIEITKANVIMKNRMRKILELAVDTKCKTLILGAFGCGVFGNKCEDISKYWNELLIDENFQIYFDIIYFTIYDKNSENLKPFEKYFK